MQKLRGASLGKFCASGGWTAHNAPCWPLTPVLCPSRATEQAAKMFGTNRAVLGPLRITEPVQSLRP